MSTNTVELHRVLKSNADRVYRAFTTPAAFAKWLPPHGFIGTVHEMDVRVGGRYRMSFTNFTTGHTHAFGGEYLEGIPAAIPAEACYLGWQESLELLAKLVEPEIRD
jgi:uncharacterized protein YndB with AHSA1/START domain